MEPNPLGSMCVLSESINIDFTIYAIILGIPEIEKPLNGEGGGGTVA